MATGNKAQGAGAGPEDPRDGVASHPQESKGCPHGGRSGVAWKGGGSEGYLWGPTARVQDHLGATLSGSCEWSPGSMGTIGVLGQTRAVTIPEAASFRKSRMVAEVPGIPALCGHPHLHSFPAPCPSSPLCSVLSPWRLLLRSGAAACSLRQPGPAPGNLDMDSEGSAWADVQGLGPAPVPLSDCRPSTS